MKPCVFISSECGLESVVGYRHIRLLPDLIRFSEVEEYSNNKEMDSQAFVMRRRLDPQSIPEIRGAAFEDVIDILDDAKASGYDTFIFILSDRKMDHYRPIVESYLEDNTTINAYYQVVKTIFFQVVLMANITIKSLANGDHLEDTLDLVKSMDADSTVFLYSPEKDRLPSVDRIEYEDDLLTVEGNNNQFYIIHQLNTTTYRVRERVKTLDHYLKMFVNEIKGKDVVPFILYTEEHSKYKKVFTGLIERYFPKIKYREIMLSPQAVMEYGANACGIGYTPKITK